MFSELLKHSVKVELITYIRKRGYILLQVFS
jgi:hypothetical protein